MSGEIDVAGDSIDFLISSANQCIQGVPGFAFVLARRDLLQAVEGCARSLSLDLLAQWKGFESDGQFRFTARTHARLAFWQSLQELEEGGGIEAGAYRDSANRQALMKGRTDLGFDTYLTPEHQSYIITSFRYPRSTPCEFLCFLLAFERTQLRHLSRQSERCRLCPHWYDRKHISATHKSAPHRYPPRTRQDANGLGAARYA